jgi:hypothetical protein
VITLHPAIIEAVVGTTPGPASGISYDVRVYRESGGDLRLTAITPTGERFPDEINTVAAKVGTVVIVAERGGRLSLLPPGESFEAEECEEVEP